MEENTYKLRIQFKCLDENGMDILKNMRVNMWTKLINSGTASQFLVEDNFHLEFQEDKEVLIEVLKTNKLRDLVKVNGLFLFGYPNKVLGEGRIIEILQSPVV